MSREGQVLVIISGSLLLASMMGVLAPILLIGGIAAGSLIIDLWQWYKGSL
jgi:hypothetical protein